MSNERRIHFHPFALDRVNLCLWKDSDAIKLRPKAFGVLDQLVSRAGELVTKHDLISAVWQDRFVGDAVLKVAIRQIREALCRRSQVPAIHRDGTSTRLPVHRGDRGASPRTTSTT